MSIASHLKKIKAVWTDHPLAGYIRAVDATSKLDVVVSEANTLPVSLADGAQLDAFGRLRVAGTGLRADVEFTLDAMPLLMESITAGGASIAHNATTRDVTLAIGDANAGTIATLPLHYHVPYTPGSGQKIDITGTLDAAGIGGGVASIFVRNNGTDVVDLPQTSWNNGVPDVDWSKSQIFSMDFQSLKVGRVRFALVRDGAEVLLHEIYNDNRRLNGYWQYPSLPLTWRIYNADGNTVMEIGYFNANNGIGFKYTIPANANAQLLAICGTVKSEGGTDLFDIAGFPFSASNGATTVTVSTTLIPLLSIQLKTTFNSKENRGLVIPLDVSFVNDNPINYRVILNPTLTGAAFASVDANSLVNFDVAASALTGGRVLESGYAGAGSARAAATRPGISGRVPLSVNYLGTVGDILTVAAIRVGATNAATGAAMDWREIR